jgi:hypothetical protein
MFLNLFKILLGVNNALQFYKMCIMMYDKYVYTILENTSLKRNCKLRLQNDLG